MPKQFSGSGAWSSGIEYYTVHAFCGSPFKASSVSGAIVLILNSSCPEFQHVMQTAAWKAVPCDNLLFHQGVEAY